MLSSFNFFQQVLKMAGADSKKVVFLFTDEQVPFYQSQFEI